ncbi:MAG TPA: dTDP-glucose 4,6-dehydratase [Bdellovibrionales bacterium]|nr:dTDP-glucose 4,6-dehydratase [Bdellovibrionales bacterium]
MTYQPKKILLTGCAGFIGSNFLRWLLQKDANVQITHLDALTYAGNLESIKDVLDNPRHRFVKGDIRDAALVKQLASDADTVINFAAESHVDRSIDGPRAFVETNVIGTFNLLEAARAKGGVRFVQISTDEVYGSLGDEGKFTEETPLAPNSPYSSSKASSDLLVRAYHHTYGLDTVTTRCSNNYGPYQFPEKLIPLMIQNALSDKPLPVYGDGLNVRDWIHVSDHSAGVWAAAPRGRPGEVYNLGSDNEWPNIDIVKRLLAILKKPESLIKYVKDRPGHDRRYAIDASKAHRELGWRPQTDFATGLEATVEWYLSNRSWVSSVTSGDYKTFYERWYRERA